MAARQPDSSATGPEGEGGARQAPAGPPRRPVAPSGDVPPPRPAGAALRHLPFEPQSATRWFNPGVLATSGLHAGLTSAFGAFLDKRELQSARPAEPDLRYAGRDEVWIDYVADTGDGFAATATVAQQVAKPALEVEGAGRLTRGDILVFGGDEVYPVASPEGYENRLEGPWRAALPWTDPAPDEPAHPTVYAVPGNHDWYDGLTGFLRLFGQGRWIGGWRTRQTRSYFAVRLPHRWWLWGVDIQSDALIDEPQLEFFADLAQRQARPGDRVVVATAVPAWTHLERDPDAYHNLAYLERAVLRRHGLDLKLTLAGDQHHYARYVHEAASPATGDGGDEVGPTHKITAGGGGAFLHPTHDLPERAVVGIDPGDPGDVTEYRLAARYPPPGRSRALSLAALLLPLRNPAFMWVPGLTSLALLWTIQFGLRSLERPGRSLADAAATWGWADVAGGIFRNSLSAAFLLVLGAGLCALAEPPPWVRNRRLRLVARLLMAGVHLTAHVLVVTTVALAALSWSSWAEGWWFAVVASVIALALGGVAGAAVVGAYLAAANALPGLRAHANEAFAASRLTRYRNFLRMHIDATGALTVYALGIDRAVPRRRWRAVPRADHPGASWILPTGDEPRPRLVDRLTIR
ncbi:MAG TPA: metallophosphoesterase [Acidimicrobiales bacterium]